MGIAAQTLIDRVKQYNPKGDFNKITRAIDYASQAHDGQLRASGEPYITHPIAVARILADYHLSETTIIAALLHDTIEDTLTTKEEISSLFGREIAELVEGLTKLKKLDLVTKKAEQAENFRKLLLAITGDVRILLIKLADRLHNMRTLGFVKPSSAKRIAEETADIYAPLAGRMGIAVMRDELERLSFRWINPEAYQALEERLAKLHEKNKGLVDEILGVLHKKLQENEINAIVSSRQKQAYSIWRKMERKQISFSQLSDIYGFRIITPEREDCYKVLGLVHMTWHAVPGRFKDYISNPKPNDYQSIHTTIVGPLKQRVELQIRDQKMHQIAEFGIAAHSIYKDAPPAKNEAEALQEMKAYRWLQGLVGNLMEGDNSEEFLEHTRLELFKDQVFCFTPNGQLIVLPHGATVIDFAYAVHTDLGNNCVGCEINGRSMPRRTELRNGDEVKILVSDGQRPRPSWEKIVVTGKARSAIRRATKEDLRQQYESLGQMILEKAAEREGHTFKSEMIDDHLHRFTQKSTIDLLTAVGRGEVPSRQVIKILFPDERQAKKIRRKSLNRTGEEGWFNLIKVMGLKFRLLNKADSKGANALGTIPVRGAGGAVPVTFCEGGAVPGDRIVGILTEGEGITIYPIQSPQLSQFDDQLDRWIDVTWDIEEDDNSYYPAKISLDAINEPGTLGIISQIIGELGSNIDNLQMAEKGPDFTTMHIELEVLDLIQLNKVIAALNKLSVVSKVERLMAMPHIS